MLTELLTVMLITCYHYKNSIFLKKMSKLEGAAAALHGSCQQICSFLIHALSIIP